MKFRFEFLFFNFVKIKEFKKSITQSYKNLEKQ